jgi:hypothetical protein
MNKKFKVIFVIVVCSIIFSPGINKSISQITFINCNEYNIISDTLTVSDIIDVLVSLGEQNWKQTGNCTDPLGVFFGIRKAGDNSVKLLSVCLYYRKPDMFYQTLKVEGPSFKFSFIWDQCDPENPGPCPIKFKNEFEIISKSRVKVKQTVYEVGKESRKYNYSGEFIKN